MSLGISAATWGMIGVGASVGGSLLSASASGDAVDAQTAAAGQADATQRYMYDQTRKDNAPFLGTGVQANNQLAYRLGLGGTPTSFKGGESGNPLWEKILGDFNAEHIAKYGIPMNRDWTADPQAMQTKAALDAQYAAAQKNDPNYGSLMRNFSAADMQADPVYQSGLQFGLDEGVKGINRMAAATGSQQSGATLKALTRFGNDYASTKGNESYNRFQTNQGNQFNRLAGISGTGQTAVGQVGAAGQSMANAVGQNALAVGNARGASSIAGANAINNGISQAWNGYQTNQLLSRLPQLNGGQQWGAAYNPGGHGQPIFGPGGEV